MILLRSGLHFIGVVDVLRLRRIGEFDPLGLKFIKNLQVDGLLNVHVLVEVRTQHVVHGLKIQTEIAERREMTAIEYRSGNRNDNGANHFWNRSHEFFGRLVNDTQFKNNAAAVHPFVIFEGRIADVRIRYDYQLATKRPYARRFDSDMLDSPHQIADDNEIPFHERLVKKYHEIIE